MISELEKKGQIDDYLYIDEEIETSSNYKFNPRIKQKFSKLNANMINKPIIWMDIKNDSIGFAYKKYYQVFKRSQIKSFSIQNVLPAKGSGGGYLQINLSDNSYTNIFSGKCHIFDEYVKKISGLTGIQVSIAEEYYDS